MTGEIYDVNDEYKLQGGFEKHPYESTIVTECGIRLAIFRQSGLVKPELRFSKQFHETAYAVFRWHDQDMKWIQVSNWFSSLGWCENRMMKLAVKYDLSVYNTEE